MKILQVTGFKNTGKTTTVNRMVKYLKSSGHCVAVIKHHHSDETEDDTDTGQFIRSGSDVTVLNTPSSSTYTVNAPPVLKNQIEYLSKEADFILIEGYKNENYPKIYLKHSFTDGTKADIFGLRSVLKTFDLRYDEDKLMDWFIKWSEDK